MLKKLLLATISAAAISGGSLANAATETFDFIDLTDNDVLEGTWDSKKVSGGTIDDTGQWLVNTIGVTASASSINNPGNAKAYLDGGGAGLGVCSSSIDSDGECSESSDDNTGIAGDDLSSDNFETLILTFTTAVKLDSLLFKDRGHADHTTGFMLEINGVPWSYGDDFSLIGPAIVFEFARIEGTDANKRDFYLDTATVTAVPLPAAAWLFGSALIGLAGVARKRKLS